METKHTKGPWKVDDQTKDWQGKDSDWRNGFRISAADNCHLAQVGFLDARYKHQAEANARLIAAAPNLLDACKHALECVLTGELASQDMLETAITHATALSMPAGPC